RNDAGLVHLLLQDGHMAGSLNDFIKVVVAGGYTRQRGAEDAARVQFDVFRAIVRTGAGLTLRILTKAGQVGLPLFPSRWQGWEAAVRRVDDQRGAPIRQAAIPPEAVISSVDVLGRAGLVAFVSGDGGFPVLRGALLFSQKLPAVILCRPFERRRSGIGPRTLQIRVAPWRLPFLRFGSRRLFRFGSGYLRHRSYRHEQQGCRNMDSITHVNILTCLSCY